MEENVLEIRESNRFSQAVSIIEQLEILLTDCHNDGDLIAKSACKMAISSLTILINKEKPPKRWEPKGGVW